VTTEMNEVSAIFCLNDKLFVQGAIPDWWAGDEDKKQCITGHFTEVICKIGEEVLLE